MPAINIKHNAGSPTGTWPLSIQEKNTARMPARGLGIKPGKCRRPHRHLAAFKYTAKKKSAHESGKKAGCPAPKRRLFVMRKKSAFEKPHNEGAFNSLFFAQKKRLSHALGFPKKIRLSPASTGRRLRAPFFWRTNAPSPCNWATTTSPRLRPPVKKSCDNIGKFILFKCLERLYRVVWTSAQGTKAPRAGASSELEHLEEESRKQDRWTRFRHLVTTELKLPYSARKSQFQRERER